MKKVAIAFVVALALAGCSDAVTKVKDAKDTLVSIGGENITKGSLYNFMKKSSGASTVNSMAIKKISEKEVPVNDEMRKNAQETLANYKKLYGDNFFAYLKRVNLSEEQYVKEYLIPSQQAKKLAEKYINENYDTIVKKYQPVQATVLRFSSKKDSEEALAKIKKGEDPLKVANAHKASGKFIKQIFTLDSKQIDALVRNAVQSQNEKLGWTTVTSSNGSSYNLVRVHSKNTKELKDSVVQYLRRNDKITSDSNTYFFKKYKFHVYDKGIYDAMKSDYPQSLVQDAK
ncbi:hypothetical protein [Bulleidia sp. zg-1006]|nr:hypothetical protein [Bulleidia sp. zg-1006]